MRWSSRRRERRRHRQDESFEEIEMIPKSGKSPAESRKAVGIHEFAALARSSLNGISQAMRDHVTKPTSLAQGRVAHLIEWKGWPRPSDPPPSTLSHFSSYCHLSEGEKEARFAAGVAEQFAIAEAKLRAWASVDDDEEEEDFNDEDTQYNEPDQPPFPSQDNSDFATSGLDSGVPRQAVIDSGEAPPPESSAGAPPAAPGDPRSALTLSPALPGDSAAESLGEEGEEGEEEEEEEEKELHGGPVEQEVALQHGNAYLAHKEQWPRRSSRFDSCYSTSHSESPGEEEEDDDDDEEEEDGGVFHEVRAWRCHPKAFFSDRASSGVASFDEEQEEEEVVEEVAEMERKWKEKEHLM